MVLPVLLALAAPPAFVQTVEHRLAGTQMHLVDWWADDLDGDRVLESIAFVCDEGTGRFLVQHGAQLLEVPAQIDGRNACPDPGPKPAWHVEHEGTITGSSASTTAAWTTSSRSATAGPCCCASTTTASTSAWPRTTHEDDDADFEALTWSSHVEPPQGKATRTSGPISARHRFACAGRRSSSVRRRSPRRAARTTR